MKFAGGGIQMDLMHNHYRVHARYRLGVLQSLHRILVGARWLQWNFEDLLGERITGPFQSLNIIAIRVAELQKQKELHVGQVYWPNNSSIQMHLLGFDLLIELRALHKIWFAGHSLLRHLLDRLHHISHHYISLLHINCCSFGYYSFSFLQIIWHSSWLAGQTN